MGALRFILALGVVVLFVSFGVKNMTPVTIQYFGLSPRQYPLFFLLLSAFVLGAAMAWLVSVMEKVRLRWRLRREQSRLREMENRVQEMEEKGLVPALSEGEDAKTSHPAEVG
ncbi:MAG: LapA family protein [Candidatus Tectomicrobia bacterium]|nr:LapA family protein [Candidatus Tectomicrobia bacterium]